LREEKDTEEEMSDATMIFLWRLFVLVDLGVIAYLLHRILEVVEATP
jgi:hypothetical protein